MSILFHAFQQLRTANSERHEHASDFLICSLRCADQKKPETQTNRSVVSRCVVEKMEMGHEESGIPYKGAEYIDNTIPRLESSTGTIESGVYCGAYSA